MNTNPSRGIAVNSARPNLAEVCQTRLLKTKWLLAPSSRIGTQWIERVVRGGQPVVNPHPSADVEDLRTAAGPLVSFAPDRPDKALDETERWLWQLTEQADRYPAQAERVESRFPHLKRGRAAQQHRNESFNEYSGHVPEAGLELSPFSDSGPVLSASGLETAGRCPLAYFFRQALKLYPPNELELDPDHWLDAAQFGTLLHDVFREFMLELAKSGLRPHFERDHQRLAQILQQSLVRWRQDVPPPNENAFRLQSWQLIECARIFLWREEEHCQASLPRYFEVALGVKPDGPGTQLDQAAPSTIGLPSGRAIRVRGRVDRVDQLGEDRYAAWDYKSGSGFGYEQDDPFRQGRRVQSILYVTMIQQALRQHVSVHSRVERFGYFFPSVRALGLRMSWNARALEGGLPVLERLCESIESGCFPATNKLDDCTFCDYRPICGDVQQVTAQSDRWLRQSLGDGLSPFRELRAENNE